MSLHDIMMERALIHFKNAGVNDDYIVQGLGNLANKVTESIVQAQEQQRLKQLEEEQYNKSIQRAKDFAKTNGGKLKLVINGNKPQVSVVPQEPKDSLYDIKTTLEIDKIKNDIVKQQVADSVVSGETSLDDFVKLPGVTSEDVSSVMQRKQLLGNPVPLTSEGAIVRTTSTPSNTIVKERDVITGLPKKTVEAEGLKRIKGIEQNVRTIGAVQKESTQRVAEAQEALNRLRNSGKELVAYAKQAVNEQGGFGFIPAMKAKIGSKVASSGLFNLPPEKQYSGQAGFEGLLEEMILSLSPIITGQKRVIEGIIERLSKTLPTTAMSEAQFTAKLKETLKNAYRVAVGLSRGVMSEDEINSLNSGDKKQIDNSIQNLIDRTKFNSEDEKMFNKWWDDVKNTPAHKAELLTDNSGQLKNVKTEDLLKMLGDL